MTILRPTPPPTGPRPQLRRPGLVIGILLGYPVLVAAVGTALIASWAPDLPEPVASQWSGAEPSSFMPVAGAIGLYVVMQLINAALLGGIGLHMIRHGQSMVAVRSFGACAAGIATFTGVLIPLTLVHQRGLADASQSDGSAMGSWLGVAALATAVAAAAAALAMPRQPEPAPFDGEGAGPALQLGAEERASWLGTARMPTGVVVLLTVPFLLAAALPLLLDGPLLVGLLPVGFGVLALAVSFWRVRVDRRGVVVRSALGWPGWTLRLDEVVQARTVTVNPVADFGGWGIRFGKAGRWGLILRSGEALELQREGRRPFVVAVEGAEEAAALVNGLLRRG